MLKSNFFPNILFDYVEFNLSAAFSLICNILYICSTA